MSKEALAKVVQRAISDAGFRRQLNSDPAGALRGFDLSADELSALKTGNAGRLATLGVDQRMSKAFAIGGAAAATRMAQSDLTAGTPAAFDDGAAGARTIIPHDPEAAANADLDGSGATRSASALNDDPDGFLAANARASGGTGSVRTGDDWKYADRSSGNAAAIEGSPEADAAAQQAGGGGMANYPAHNGLAGPSQVSSARAGDDWARAGTARIDDSGRIGAARLDDASGSSSGASTISDDPDGFLAANANADFSGGASRGDGTAFVDDSQDPAYLSTVGYDASAASSAVSDAHDRGANVNVLASRASAGDGTAFVDDSQDPAYTTSAFVDESEGYLTKVGYDASAATTANTRATWSGDENAGPASVADDDGGASPNATEAGPNITP